MPIRNRTDLTDECFGPEARRHVDLKQFRETCCNHCRNPDCLQAKWGRTPFDIRMETQVDRLLVNPQFSDLTSPKHLLIHQQDFPDISHKMKRLMIAAKRNDWTYIPEEDGMKETSGAEATSAVDRAVEKLARMRGKEPPKPVATEPEPTPEPEPLPEPEPTPLPEPEPPLPEPERVPLTAAEERRARKLDKETGSNRVPTKPQGEPSTHDLQQQINSPIVPGGIMIDDAPAPKRDPNKPDDPDAWAPRRKPDERFVEPGTKVVLGDRKKDGD